MKRLARRTGDVEGVALGRGGVDHRRDDRLVVDLPPAGRRLGVDVEAEVRRLGRRGPAQHRRAARTGPPGPTTGSPAWRWRTSAGRAALGGHAGGGGVPQVGRVVGPVGGGRRGDRVVLPGVAGVGEVVGEGSGVAGADDAGRAVAAARRDPGDRAVGRVVGDGAGAPALMFETVPLVWS